MILARVFLVGSAAFALAACVGPDGQPMSLGDFAGGASQGGYPPPQGAYPQQQPQQGGYYPQQQGGYPGAVNGYPQQQAGGYGYPAPNQSPYGAGQQQQYQPATPPRISDYPAHLRDEYRSAYDLGARDRSYGYLSDYKRAYTRFGHGFESYFQEGYNDGFNGARMRH